MSPSCEGSDPFSDSSQIPEHAVCVCQAVEEVLATMEPVFAKHPEMIDVVERLVEPERMIAFRVAWVDDAGKQHVRY